MSGTRTLIELVGAVALLMWGIHMVSGGVQRAFGSNLRNALGRGLRSRASAFLVGFGVTAALQSSTATALMVSSFSMAGAVDLAPALAVMLGANVGTTLITQALSFDVAFVYPLLIAAGVFVWRRARAAVVRDLAQAVLGVGLMLLSLHLLVQAMTPVENSAAFAAMLGAISAEPLLCLGVAALFAFAAHSSVAAVLLVASLAGAGHLGPHAVVAMILGCNLGSALNPLVDALGGGAERLRAPAGNLLNRVAGCALALPFADVLARAVMAVDPSPARLAANFHLLFNVVMAALFIGILPALARLLERIFPERPASDPGAARYLDEAALSTPSVALANAAREVLRMADVVEAMLRGSQGAFDRDDREKIAEIGARDDVLDRLYVSIQRYIGMIDHEALSAAEGRRIAETIAFAINFEHIGDIVEKNLMQLAAKRIRAGLRLDGDALAAIDDMHRRLLEHLRLAVAVYMSGDGDAARRLVQEKEQFRDLEREATERHMRAMRAGGAETIEASALQLDIARDLKRIEAHIAATAYGLLEHAGALRASRLRANDAPGAAA